MLVVLYFHQLGYSPLDIALLFLFYEFFGVVTNLFGGWLGARIGLNRTMNIGLGLQVFALVMLLVPTALLTVPWVMAAQALSGIAKDLNKMSAKSSVKLLVKDGAENTLFKWVAVLTGSKNALKGVGFFLGGLLLSLLGFAGAVALMAVILALTCLFSLVYLQADLGRSRFKPKFTQMFSQSQAINALAAARLFLFAARDIWFVVAVPVFMATQLGWTHTEIGTFLAIWIIGYGLVQAWAPRLYRQHHPTGRAALGWVALLMLVPALLALALDEWRVQWVLLVGLLIFGVVFAVNSSIHSYLVVSYAQRDQVSMEVGFYYMANAMGRLLGTVLSGWIYQDYGLGACLWCASLMLLLATLLSLRLPAAPRQAVSR